MSLSAAAMRILAEKGLSLEDIITVAEANAAASMTAVETSADRRRRLDRERKAALRSAEKADNSADIADKPCPQISAEKAEMSAESADKSPPLARVRDNPSRLVISGQTVVDVSASALEQPDDWPTQNCVECLVAEVASPRLDPSKSPGLVQTAGRLAAWRRDGASWQFDVLPVVKATCAKARLPIGSWKYFDPAIAQSIADNRRALEIPEATPLRAGGPVVSFADKIGADNAEARRRAFELLDAREARNG